MNSGRNSSHLLLEEKVAERLLAAGAGTEATAQVYSIFLQYLRSIFLPKREISNNVVGFDGGFDQNSARSSSHVFKAHRLCVSLNSRLESSEEEEESDEGEEKVAEKLLAAGAGQEATDQVDCKPS